MGLKKNYNSDYFLTQGASGSILYFTLFDADGPLDLTGWDVTLTVANLAAGGTGFTDETCTIDADQVNNKGKGYFEFDVTTAGLELGEYKLRFKGVDALGKIRYFPTGRGAANYGRLIVGPA